MQQYIRNSTLLLLSLLISLKMYGQISATATCQEQDPYPTTKNFFFPVINGATISGSGSLTGNTSCSWRKYDPLTNSFSITVQTDIGSASTLNTPLAHNDGYEFSCTDGTNTVKYYCWTFEPKITLDSIYVEINNCTNIGLKAQIKTIDCIYRDPLNLPSNAKKVDYQLVYDWTATPMDVDIPKVFNPNFIQPIEDTQYAISISNGLGLGNNSKEMSTIHTAKGLRAGFIMSTLSPSSDEDNMLDSIPTMASGPFTVGFKNDSKGNYDFAEIRIYKDEATVPYSTIPDDQQRPYTFKEQGTYRIQMVISNYTSQCISISQQSDSVVTVGGSVMGIPNTFTPDGDGQNDEFRIVYLSLKEYQINIYNRWGRLVYTSDDPLRGWDGGGLAVGVYMYVIEAVGIDGRTYKEKGPIHLLRKN